MGMLVVRTSLLFVGSVTIDLLILGRYFMAKNLTVEGFMESPRSTYPKIVIYFIFLSQSEYSMYS